MPLTEEKIPPFWFLSDSLAIVTPEQNWALHRTLQGANRRADIGVACAAVVHFSAIRARNTGSAEGFFTKTFRAAGRNNRLKLA